MSFIFFICSDEIGNQGLDMIVVRQNRDQLTLIQIFALLFYDFVAQLRYFIAESPDFSHFHGFLSDGFQVNFCVEAVLLGCWDLVVLVVAR